MKKFFNFIFIAELFHNIVGWPYGELTGIEGSSIQFHGHSIDERNGCRSIKHHKSMEREEKISEC